MKRFLKKFRPSTGTFFFDLSTAWLTWMATTGVSVSYFDPIISNKEPHFFRPGYGSFEVCQERSDVRFRHMDLLESESFG